jgi:hypothetical protein
MRIRDVYLVNQQTLNDAETVTVDLTRSLKILKLRIQYQATNGATSNTLAKLNAMVSKLQVIDGSNVLHSLSLAEEQALNCFKYRRFPYQYLSQAAAGVVVEECIIDFRRMLGEVNWYLDTSRYLNPQLQLTHSLTISATAGFATGTGKLSVIATVLDSGAPPSAGFVSAKEIDSFSSAAAGDHVTDLPLDFPIAALLVSNPVTAKGPDETLSNFKVTIDTDSYIPIDESYADLMRRNIDEYGLFEQFIQYLNDTSATPKFDLYEHTRGATGPAGATGKGILTLLDQEAATLAMTTGDAAANLVHARGACPHSSVFYTFGDGWSPDQILVPAGIGKAQLKLTNAATGATPKVVVVQHRG